MDDEGGREERNKEGGRKRGRMKAAVESGATKKEKLRMSGSGENKGGGRRKNLASKPSHKYLLLCLAPKKIFYLFWPKIVNFLRIDHQKTNGSQVEDLI